MGRQIQVASTAGDTIRFEKFLRETYDIILFQSFSNSIESLAVESLSSSFFIAIWNKEFAWSPEYKVTLTDKKQTYISNKSGAPLIEFTNTNWNESPEIIGRLYWAKTFSTSEVNYDISRFETFYEKISGWIKKEAKGKIKVGNTNEYYLQEAWDWKNR